MTYCYQCIQAMEKDYPLTKLCTAFAVSRSGHYNWCARKPWVSQQANTQLLAEIQTLRQGEEACYGSPRMTQELEDRGYPCSENRVARLMRQHGLRAQAQPRFVPSTTGGSVQLKANAARVEKIPPAKFKCLVNQDTKKVFASAMWHLSFEH